MKRRQLIRYGGMGLATAIATSFIPRRSAIAQEEGVTVQYL